MWLELISVGAVFAAGWYLGWTNGLPFLRKRSIPWSIGIYEGETPFDLAPAERAANPVLTAGDVDDTEAEFVADPFLLRQGAGWIMFFEVLERETQKGCIAAATSADGVDWSYDGVVLREPFHLSYPHVFRWEDDVYMVPDTPESYEVRLYRAEVFPRQWAFVSTLVGGPLVDPTIVRHRGRWWLFACSTPYEHHTLRLYHADALTGPWEEHPDSPLIQGDPHRARPGGRMLSHDGELVRIAQDDAPDYGRQVWGFRVTEMSPTRYREEPLRDTPVLSPGDEPWCARGMHHLDARRRDDGRWIAAVDGKGEEWSFARPRLRLRPPGRAVRGVRAVLGSAPAARGSAEPS